MVWIPPGEFAMGSEDFYPEERPVRRVAVEGFWMDEHPVTAAVYRRFVRERATSLSPSGRSTLRTIPTPTLSSSRRDRSSFGKRWARWTWGAGTTINGRDRHPVVQRQGEAIDTSTGHIGFRCIVRPDRRESAHG